MYVSVRRSGGPKPAQASWHDARVVAYAADARRHTVQYAKDNTAGDFTEDPLNPGFILIPCTLNPRIQNRR